MTYECQQSNSILCFRRTCRKEKSAEGERAWFSAEGRKSEPEV